MLQHLAIKQSHSTHSFLAHKALRSRNQKCAETGTQYTAAASLFPDLLLNPEMMTGAISERSASLWMSARGVVLVPVYLSLLPGRSGCQIPMVSCLPGSEGTLHCLYDPWKPRGESSGISQRFKDLNSQNITYKSE